MFKTQLAYENWRTKYRYNDETPMETWQRVAKALASAEKNPDEWYDKFLRTIVKLHPETNEPEGLKCTPGGRITANAGTTFNGATLINCFSGDTEFLTANGIKSLSSTVNTIQEIVSTEGELINGRVNTMGKQPLNKIVFCPCGIEYLYRNNKNGCMSNEDDTNSIKQVSYRPFRRSKYQVDIFSTLNHVWELVDGKTTDRIRIGDYVPSNSPKWVIDEQKYKEGMKHGIMFGDGSNEYEYVNSDQIKYRVRLCGEKSKYAYLFDEIKHFDSCDKDPVCFFISNKKLKELPCEFEISYIKGFIDGYIAMDGSNNTNQSAQLTSVNKEALEWVKRYSIYAGYVSFNVKKDKIEDTNFGNRKLYRLNMTRADKVVWKVVDIFGGIIYDDVFCLDVPEKHRFTLSHGIYTSNCYINGPVTSAKISYKRKDSQGIREYPIEIDTAETPDSLHNIFLTILEQAKTLAAEGGYGINFSFIRPRGSIINSIGIKHPGVVSYMQIWDSVSECIVKGDTDGYKDKIKNLLVDEKQQNELKAAVKKMVRKGAMMGCLNISHPDIEEFIRAKQESGKLTKFNISVAVDDLFMGAVENNEEYELKFGGKIFKKIKATDLYDLMMESTYNRAEPGILFVDNMHRNNPIAYLGRCECTNPCGEIPGLADLTTVCLLGSLNLTQYVKDDRTFDFDAYAEDIQVFTRMLDNVNDIVTNPLPSYDWAVKNFRQIGMGVNGLGSMLIMLGIPYNSEEAIAFTKRVCQIKENLTWQTSALLAKEKGAFPAYEKEKFEATEYFNSARITEETKVLMKKYGVRNAKTTTNPPLGNSSVVCDNVSNGIEPLLSLEYERITIASQWPEGLSKDNVMDELKQYKKKDYVYWRGNYNGKTYYYEPHNRGLCEVSIIRDYGWAWVLEHFPEVDHTYYAITSSKMKAEDHLNVQEVVQFYCNQSVSKTVNLPQAYGFSNFKELYMSAWKRGLNGLTTYREGSMEAVITSIENAEKTRAIIDKDMKLPSTFLNGPTTVIKREGMKFYIHFSYLPEDINMNFPVCMWITTNSKTNGVDVCNKAAKELAKLALSCGINNKIVDVAIEKSNTDEPYNKLGRMISLCLRHNIPRDRVYVALCGIEGDHISSLLTVVRKFISSTITDGTQLQGIKCEACGGENVLMLSGCKQCMDCGSSACG